MSPATAAVLSKVRIREASVEFIEQPFLKPLQLSSGLITKATEARATVRVEVGGRDGIGHGSIYLSDLWAWPGARPDRSAKDVAMRSLCVRLAEDLGKHCGGESAHPLELGLRLHHALGEMSGEAGMPLLAQCVCASIFDAAIHDAAGNALNKSAFAFYDEPVALPSADRYFKGESAAAAIRSALREPVDELDAWWIVGARDDLETTLLPAVRRSGFRCIKIKTLGADNQEDARRTSEIYEFLRQAGVEKPVLSIDSNEGNPDAGAVNDYLERLERINPAAFEALAYLEQPTSRDIEGDPQNWSGVSRPVLLDEGLTSIELLPLALEQRWGGLALKTCKGHSFALTSAAWAVENRMSLALQDLTNPGYSAIHAFLFGAHLPMINGVEINSPQYTPAANEPWLPEFRDLFEPQDGKHRFEVGKHVGLGGAVLGPDKI